MLKSILERLAPRFLSSVKAVRNRSYFRRQFGQLQSAVLRDLYQSDEARVLTGPFRGMRYLNATVWGSITPKWLGSYECELEPTIEYIIRREYDTLVDIGCAEGYYAIGLATRCFKSKIIAFDTDFISRRQARMHCKLNGTDERVSIKEYCSHDDLQDLTGPRSAVICDIEGFERQLLNPTLSPNLRQTDILVEVHESPSTPHATRDTLISRFSGTHEIEFIYARDRSDWISKAPESITEALAPELLSRAVEEHRANGQLWLWLTAKA